MRRQLLFTQGIFYLLTGLWPVAEVRSFMYVTGPKTDVWLVKMVGLLTISIAWVILNQLSKKKPNLLPGCCTAFSFLIIDLYYSLNGTISKIYLADAAVELIFLVIALFYMFRKKKQPV